MPAPFEELLVDHSYICNALGELMNNWHQREDTGPLWMELLEPLAARIGFASSSLENLLSGTVRGGHTNTPVTFPDLPSIYTLARTQLEAYLTFFYLYIGPQSDEERALKYNIYVAGGLASRQSLKDEFEQLYLETQDERLPLLLTQIQQEGDRIERLRTQIEGNPLFNSMYDAQQRRNIMSTTQPRTRTQGWIGIIKSSPLSTIGFTNRWSLYSAHAHSEFVSLLQLRDYISNVAEHDSYTRHMALKGSLMVLSTFIVQFVQYLRLETYYDTFPEDLRKAIDFWKEFAKGD
ncbi:hypothetical protein ACVWYF_002756 [Hymenobacter sp. UYAg731]